MRDTGVLQRKLTFTAAGILPLLIKVGQPKLMPARAARTYYKKLPDALATYVTSCPSSGTLTSILA
jgi:hypothetical protein